MGSSGAKGELTLPSALTIRRVPLLRQRHRQREYEDGQVQISTPSKHLQVLDNNVTWPVAALKNMV